MISVCNSLEFIRSFMMLPEIYRYAAEYGNNPDKIEFTDGEKEMWLTYHQGRDKVGLIHLQIETGAMCSFHPYILRANKESYNNMVKLFFEWFMGNMPDKAVKLNAIIPSIFPGPLKAARAAGMVEEGVDRLSYRTENGVYDRILMGITREEMTNG